LRQDYAEWIIEENPNIAIVDGPPTYQLGYMMIVTNFKRTLENMIKILRESDIELIIWDHHLPRDIKWRERVKIVLEEAKKRKKKLIVASEFYGKKAVADLVVDLRTRKRILKKNYLIPPKLSIRELREYLKTTIKTAHKSR